MLEQLFKALGVVTINSKASEEGDYYEYHLQTAQDGKDSIVRTKRNNGVFGGGKEAVTEAVKTDEQVEECKQALMYNYPEAFNEDGNVAIDLSNVEEEEQDNTQLQPND